MKAGPRGERSSRPRAASLEGNDVEEAKHGGAAVLDLHDLVAARAEGGRLQCGLGRGSPWRILVAYSTQALS